MPQKGPLEPPASTAALRSPGGSGNGAPEAQHERRVLTALCYDMVGSTDLLGQLDIEDFQDLMAAFQRAAGRRFRHFRVVRLEAGDGGIALFPLGIDAKDAASLAIKAGLGVVQACKRVGAEKGRPDLQVRVGVATSMSLVNRAIGPLARQRRYRRGVCACDKAAGHCTAQYGARFRRNAKPRAPVACIQLRGHPPDQGLRRAGTGLAGAQPQARIGSVLRLRPGERPNGRPCSRTGPDRGTLNGPVPETAAPS